jgi:uncharacterized protein involved in exopolysaccharide biosynthesis
MMFSYRFYFSLLMKRLPIMIALVMIGSMFGIVTAIRVPPTYTTSARLLVADPTIVLDQRGGGVSPEIDAQEQLSVIEQRLMTRANLIDIANKYTVFENLENMSPDDVYAIMRGNTSIRRTGGRNEATLMSISFSGRNGQVVANVVNEYVTLIQQANSRDRETRVEGTLGFFQREVARLKQELEQQSARIVEFKNQNEGALPDDLSFRLGRQALLQERQGRLERDITAAQTQRQEMIRVFEATGRVENAASDVALSPDQQQLAELRRQLDILTTTLSLSNPRVVQLQRQIDRLEANLASVAASDTQVPTPEVAVPSMLEVSLSEIDSRLKLAQDELGQTNTELDNLERSITATSSNAITLASLERDYNNSQAQFNAAVGNLNEAQRNGTIDSSTLGQRIELIEAAALPQNPSGPNRTMIAATGIGGGIGMAGGLFVLLELLNLTIRRPAEIESRFGIRPIAAIPYIESGQEQMWRRSFLLGALLMVIVGVPALMWYVHTNIMPLEIVVAKISARLGL